MLSRSGGEGVVEVEIALFQRDDRGKQHLARCQHAGGLTQAKLGTASRQLLRLLGRHVGGGPDPDA